MINSLL
jgi:protein phosphatase